jgi:asparagine synthetase B (glutamine-hydrolysing)
MSGTLAEIIEKVETLTNEEREVLLKTLQEDRASIVDRLYGKYAFVPNSSDAFCARKREEVELEDRHRS